ncbi:MAG: hypothetical protein JWM89_3840, partial [Acidimicrobiales bacterium]|nr:hypothetical protein [Acidimicrobiales bacterium]
LGSASRRRTRSNPWLGTEQRQGSSPAHHRGGRLEHGRDPGALEEHICPQIPQTDPDFKRLYRRRNDAESINRALDDTLWLRRAHSVGHARQHLNLLT